MFSKIQKHINSVTQNQKQRYDLQHQAAMRKYNERYDPKRFNAATEKMTVDEGNELIDAAMALCGSPYFTTRPGLFPQTKESNEFLSLFRSNPRRIPTESGGEIAFHLDAIPT